MMILDFLDPIPLSAVDWILDTLVIFSLTCPLSCLLLVNMHFTLEAEFRTYQLRSLERDI